MSCRNLLIYVNREMQEHVLTTFHFALLPDSHLFLGTSESAEGVRSLFFPTDKKHRIYARRAAIAAFHTMPAALRVGAHSAKSADLAVPGARVVSFGELHHRVVEQLAPPSCLVNEVYDVVHLSEHAGRYFRFTGGELSRNLLAVVRPELRQRSAESDELDRYWHRFSRPRAANQTLHGACPGVIQYHFGGYRAATPAFHPQT